MSIYPITGQGVSVSSGETKGRLKEQAVIVGALSAIAGIAYFWGPWGAIGACAACGTAYLIHSWTRVEKSASLDVKAAAEFAQTNPGTSKPSGRASYPLCLPPNAFQASAPARPSQFLALSSPVPGLMPPKSYSGDWIQQKMHQFSQSGCIYFYDHTNPATEWLGNFYDITIQFNGLIFKNSEAAFQAQKFIHDHRLMQRFTNLSGDQAFQLARDYQAFIRSDWMQVRIKTMQDVLHTKIIQHPEIALWLKATGKAYLVEHNPVKGRDAFWSDDSDGTGQNMLGQLWMRERLLL